MQAALPQAREPTLPCLAKFQSCFTIPASTLLRCAASSWKVIGPCSCSHSFRYVVLENARFMPMQIELPARQDLRSPTHADTPKSKYVAALHGLIYFGVRFLRFDVAKRLPPMLTLARHFATGQSMQSSFRQKGDVRGERVSIAMTRW